MKTLARISIVMLLSLVLFSMSGMMRDLSARSSEQSDLPSWVGEAIRFGSTKDVKPYVIERKMVMVHVPFGSLTTPYLRVAIAAAEARKKLLTFDTSMVTPEMLANTLVVSILPIMRGPDSAGGVRVPADYRSAEHVVIKKPKSKDPKDAIQPLSIVPFSETAQNGFGARVEKQGIIATFPLESFREGWVFYLIYESSFATKSDLELPITKEMIQQAIKQ